MPDVFDPDTRRRVMVSIRSKNGKAERLTFSYLRRNRIYFQKHYARAPGKPDVALPRKKKAVFIDGDFWHGRNYMHRLKGRSPEDPWIVKIERNIARDMQQSGALKKSGWSVLRIWESDVNRKRTQQQSLEKIKKFLTS